MNRKKAESVPWLSRAVCVAWLSRAVENCTRARAPCTTHGPETHAPDKFTTPWSIVRPIIAHAQVAPPAEGEMESLFNGKDLSGWNRDTRLWSVVDGAIHGETTVKNRAEGKHLQHFLNGRQFLDYTDNSPKALSEGVIALQLHGGRAMWAEYKDLRIKQP